jgi:hypothetical protein
MDTETTNPIQAIMPPPPPTQTEEPLTLNPSTQGSEPSTLNPYMMPTIKKNNIGDGQFTYVESITQREMLQTAWSAVTVTESWPFLRTFPDSFMTADKKRIKQIYYKIEELGYTGHSGCSFALTMRNMQFLAEHGEASFVKTWNN